MYTLSNIVTNLLLLAFFSINTHYLTTSRIPPHPPSHHTLTTPSPPPLTSQAEQQRQASRVAELEALNAVLRTQLDAAADGEATNLREIQRELDRAEFEASRLRDRLGDVEAKVSE